VSFEKVAPDIHEYHFGLLDDDVPRQTTVARQVIAAMVIGTGACCTSCGGTEYLLDINHSPT
jgi:hypothetical protein